MRALAILIVIVVLMWASWYWSIRSRRRLPRLASVAMYIACFTCYWCLWVDAVFGVPYFVATTGHDTNNDGLSAENPFLTIKKAADTADATVVNVAAGDYAENASNGLVIGLTDRTVLIQGPAGAIATGATATHARIRTPSEYVVNLSGGSGSTITLKNLILESTAAGNLGRPLTMSVADTLIVDNCRLGTASATGEVTNQKGIGLDLSAKGGSFSITNSYIYGRGTRSAVWVNNIAHSRFENCVIDYVGTLGSGGAVEFYGGTLDSIIFKDCTITSGAYGFYTYNAIVVDRVEIIGGSVTSVKEPCYFHGKRVADSLGTTPRFANVRLYGVAIVHDSRAPATPNADWSICFGEDSYSDNIPFTSIVVDSCTLHRYGATRDGAGDHGLLMSPGQIGAIISNNTIIGAAYGMVCKGSGHLIERNVVIQATDADDVVGGTGEANCVYLKGCSRSRILNNTFIGNAPLRGFTLKIMDQNGLTVTSGGNVVENNIIQGANSKAALSIDPTIGASNILDYNTYYTGAATQCWLDSGTATTGAVTLAQLQTWWGATVTQPGPLLVSSASTVTIAEGTPTVVTLTTGAWPGWAAHATLVVGADTYTVQSRDSNSQLTISAAGTAVSESAYTLTMSPMAMVTERGRLNDAHSLTGNPLLISLTTGSGAMYGNSPAISTGWPLYSTMGAWVPNPRQRYGTIGANGIFGPE